ncbi:MAG: hypothetical protein C0601_02610 [Candidatus Muiribacterium halophilum]|uniref:Glycosyl transferase family 1 domain-containing protein n=1 Tax=Muiribacterium halophilum TaxID=2053465 RepID=A0A2N5ZKF8_MUIH1|nr:MAG: hypothetical protein C0601_02610 [Candidatus Muirbacterium halophilum]
MGRTKNKKIIVHIGPLPPPYGGISVFLERLKDRSKDISFIDEDEIFKNRRSIMKWLLEKIFDKRRKLFVFHSAYLRNRLFFLLLSKVSIHQYALVLHGNGLENDFKSKNIFYKFLIIKLLNNSKYVRCINSHIYDFVKRNTENKNVFIKNAFIPPDLNNLEQIYKGYPKELKNILDKKNNIFLINASRIELYGKIDLYGIDMSLKLVKELKNMNKDVFLIIAIADEKFNYDYIKTMKKYTKDNCIEDNVYWWLGQKKIWPLFKKINVFLRPTYEDGYGISIDEAIMMGAKAIASDVCERNPNAIIFKNRDFEDLKKKVLKIID